MSVDMSTSLMYALVQNMVTRVKSGLFHFLRQSQVKWKNQIYIVYCATVH